MIAPTPVLGLRAVSTLEVLDPAEWSRLWSGGLQPTWLGDALTPTCRIIRDEGAVLSHLGRRALVRYARRPPAQQAADDAARRATISALPSHARRVLFCAQRHAVEDIVVGLHAWDPEADAPSVRALHGAELLRPLSPEEPLYLGRYRLAAGLPLPPPIPYDFTEAAMSLAGVDDLSAPGPGLIALMHDMAALATAILQTHPRRTHAGELVKADARKLGHRLGEPRLASGGDLRAAPPRWSLALRALEALHAVRIDPLARTLDIEPGLEDTLTGDTPDAIDRLVHRLVDRDQHVLLPAVRTALQQAGVEGGVDTVIFCELLREQQRDVLFPPWERSAGSVYPHLPGESVAPYDDAHFERIEVPTLLRLLKRLGLVRRAEGIFAATPDGHIWSRAHQPPPSSLWIGSDLELIVPPEAITPWERFQIERLTRCLMRDVVDRYILDREGLSAWLVAHDLEDALALLHRRCPGVPEVVEATLRGWAQAALQVVITHGVLLPHPESPP